MLLLSPIFSDGSVEVSSRFPFPLAATFFFFRLPIDPLAAQPNSTAVATIRHCCTFAFSPLLLLSRRHAALVVEGFLLRSRRDGGRARTANGSETKANTRTDGRTDGRCRLDGEKEDESGENRRTLAPCCWLDTGLSVAPPAAPLVSGAVAAPLRSSHRRSRSSLSLNVTRCAQLVAQRCRDRP